jgi:hypothetical protein
VNEPIRLQVAFAGHNRARDMGNASSLSRVLNLAFGRLKAAGVSSARLLTGLAPGADELGARAWIRAELGPVHAIYPFLSDIRSPLADTATWLDGETAIRAGRNPHLAQTRWLLSHADLLVAVWTGRRARGAGGTGDAVRVALESGLPILWIEPGTMVLRLIGGPGEPALDFLEVMETLRQMARPIERMSAQALAEDLGLGQPDIVESVEPPPSRIDRWLHRSLWRTFALFQRLAGGPHGPRVEVTPPADLANQAGFKELSTAYVSADRRATRLAAVHRSEQILLLLVAVAAAVVGSAPAVWESLKIPAVFGELVLGLGALGVWLSANRARRHMRWTQARRLAEQLRLERVAWALGISAGSGPSAHRREKTLAPGLLRRIPPAQGSFDADRVARWGAWASEELIAGQARYHHEQADRNRRIAHRIHLAEDGTFFFLLGALACFLVANPMVEARGYELDHWVVGIVLMSSVIVPAIGAASIALEAKLEFEEQAERSTALVARLDELAARLPAPNLEALQATARDAIERLLSEADQWREGARRRQLTRGG